MNDPEYLTGIVVKLLRSPPRKTVTVEIEFGECELVPGLSLSRLQIVIAEEGIILGGCLELSELDATLSVSPESLVAPE